MSHFKFYSAIYQSEEKALKIFTDLNQSNVSPKIKNKPTHMIRDSEGNERFLMP